MRAMLISWTYSGAIGAVLVAIFMPLFVGLVWWIWRKSRKPLYEELSTMPLRDEPDR